MAKIWNNPITDSTDWGGDSSTNNLPVSGQQVQAWIKQRLSNIKTDVQLEDFITNILEEKGIAADGGFVTLKTEQTVEGAKDFIGGLKVSGAPIQYDAVKNAWVFAGNMIITRGLAVYTSIDDFDKVSVFEDIPIDSETIKWEDGKLVAVGGGSGSGSGGIDEDQLQEYLDDNNYVNQIWINEQKYATQQWVEDKKYLTEASLGEKFVTIDTEQEIKAIKNFVAGLKVGGKQITYDSAKNAIILPTNVVIEGGLATYSSLKEDDVLSVFDGLPIDGTTIYWSVDADGNKILKSAGGSGSGEGGGLSIEDVKGYLEGNSYIRQQDLDSAGYITEEALEGYEFATQSWVADKGYALNSELEAVSTKLNNFLEGSDTDAIINKWSELEVFLSGLAETENLATILATKFNTADFTKANIKDKLGIADWALSTTNPSYTKAEADGKYLLKTGTAADSSKLGGVAATYFARWADHVVASSSYKHLGYGYSSDGWYTTGPATVFGVSNYKAALQFRWTDSHFYAGYGYETNELSNWKQLAYISDTVDAAKKLLSNSKSVYYDSAKDTWVVEGNLIVTGGLATYTKLTGFTNLDVMGGILVDDDTIYINSAGQLAARVVSGGGTVELTAQAIKSALGYTPYNGDANPNGYLASAALNGYATQDWVAEQGFLTEHQSLEGYATQTWVTDKGYALQSSLTAVDNRLKSVETFFATDDNDTLINKWDEIVTFLNAVEGDTLDSILSTKFDKANFTKSNIKSTLGISDWALAASKPSYAWSEITSKPSYIFYSKNAIINPTDTTFRNTSGYAYSTDGGGTTGVWASFYSNNYLAQMQFNYASAIPYVRVYDNTASAWSDWKRIALHSTFDNYVPLATAKDITAIHNFTNGIKLFGKSPFSYNAAKDTWELNGNLVITKGLATYTRLSGFEDLGIMAAIEVDGTTISKDGGVLHFIGEASSGVDEGAVNTLISKALVGYATESWVTNKGYALQSSLTAVDNRLKSVETFFATDDNDTLINKWDEIVAFLNAVEGDTLDSILSTKFDKANFTKSNIKNTLGISDWALAASKPSYAWSEITSKPTTLSGYGITNAYTKTEVQDNYLALTGGELSGNITVKRSGAMIAASNNKDYIGLHNESNCGLWYAQGTTTNGSKWLLGFNTTRSAGWLTVPLAIGTTAARSDYMLYVNGNSRFAGSLTPNAHLSYNIGSSSEAFLRTYTQYLDSPTSYNLRLCSAGTEVITITTGGNVRIGAPSGTSRAKFDVTGDIYTSEGLNVNGAMLTYDSAKKSWQLVGNLIVTGGLATYSTLTGVDLDEYLTTAGGKVSGAILPNSSNTIDLGAVGNEWQTVYARSIQAKAGWGIRFYTGASGATPTSKMIIGTSGRVAIGTESASERLHVAGNIYVTGTVTENSARKLKNVEYEGEGIALDVLKKVKVAKWHWKDKRDKKLHIGAIADDLVSIIPEVVIESEDENGVKSTGIAYGKAGFSIAASLIAPVARHEDRIKELERNIEQMQKELNKLKKSA